MPKSITVFIICICLTSQTQAANVITFGTDSMVVFPHKQHQNDLGDCTGCHGAGEPGRIARLDQKWAHTTCIGCHSENKAGPVECAGCHTQL